MLVGLLLLLPYEAAGGQRVDPSPPVAPEVISRDPSQTRATARATRVTAVLRIDGKLDEEVYARVKPIADFIQMEPVEGAPATEKTEVCVFFDNAAAPIAAWRS